MSMFRKGKIDKDEIIILSRNHNEPQLCTCCKKNKAKWIDAYAENEKDWMLCDKCRNKKYDKERGEQAAAKLGAKSSYRYQSKLC